MLEWRAPEVDEGRVVALAAAIGVRRLTARILIARGLVDESTAARFLTPRLADMRPPAGMADLDRAVERIVAALDGRQRIGVFGDYDVDGVTTAAMLATTLRALGGDVLPRVASRRAGYGLGVADVARFADDGCALLITGDCGTSDFEALAHARQRGVNVIVIDHHQIPSGETAAFALINPHRADDGFPFKGLASCGVAFYLAAALRARLRERGTAFDPRDLLDLVALGSVADMVPLVDENRILVAAGLRALTARKRPGVAALCEAANIPADRTLDADDISFRLAPRLNAAGRLGEAQLALDVLLAATPDEARRLTAELDERNRQRQRIQEEVWTAALQMAESHADDAAVVVGADGWHPGVVGIIAARMVEKFARPAVVIGFEDGQGRGSARTVGGFNLYEALVQCRAHLTRFGGHAAAAGMSLARESLDDFRRSFVAEAARARQQPARPALNVDAVVDLADFDTTMAEEIGRLAPFGAANAEPLLVFAGVTAQSTRRVGQGHLQLTLAQHGSMSDAIAFGMADRDPGSGASVDVVATATLDTFRGARRTRLKIRHLHPSRHT